MFFRYFFPKTDINTKNIGKLLDDYQKNKFLVHDEICFECKKESKNFKTHTFCNKDISRFVTCFYYTKEIKKYILAFKYYHKKEIIDDIGKLLSIFYYIYFSNLKKEETIITFVPMHWFRKYFYKGYNQSELLAKSLGKILNIKVTKICKKIKYTKPQAKINKREERLRNINDSFKCHFDYKNIKNIIIIDDIVTTGTTIKELTKSIKAVKKGINIYALVIARK